MTAARKFFEEFWNFDALRENSFFFYATYKTFYNAQKVFFKKISSIFLLAIFAKFSMQRKKSSTSVLDYYMQSKTELKL